MRHLKALLIAVFLLITGSIVLTIATPPVYADYCHDKYPKPWQELDRQRCRIEFAQRIGGSDAAPGIFNIKNNSGETVWVAMTYYYPTSDGRYGRWITKGWYEVSPGQTYRLLKNYHNQWLYLYANSTSYKWSGEYQTWVVNEKFSGGEFGVDPSRAGAYRVGFFKQFTGIDSRPFTLTLN